MSFWEHSIVNNILIQIKLPNTHAFIFDLKHILELLLTSTHVYSISFTKSLKRLLWASVSHPRTSQSPKIKIILRESFHNLAKNERISSEKQLVKLFFGKIPKISSLKNIKIIICEFSVKLWKFVVDFTKNCDNRWCQTISVIFASEFFWVRWVRLKTIWPKLFWQSDPKFFHFSFFSFY